MALRLPPDHDISQLRSQHDMALPEHGTSEVSDALPSWGFRSFDDTERCDSAALTVLQVAYDMAYSNFFSALDRIEVILSRSRCAWRVRHEYCTRQHAEHVDRKAWRIACSVMVMIG